MLMRCVGVRVSFIWLSSTALPPGAKYLLFFFPFVLFLCFFFTFSIPFRVFNIWFEAYL